MTTRILVLGAGGFIGTHLCAALAAEGWDTIGFGRGERPAELAGVPGVSWIRGDLGDRALLRRALEGCRVAVHLVGSTAPAGAGTDPVTELQADLAGGVGLLEAVREAGVGRVVFASSGGTVYGLTGDGPVPETAPTEPLCSYGIVKLAFEKYLALHRHLHGLDYRVLRIANVFGERQRVRRQQGVIAAFMTAAVEGRPLEVWGDGSVVRDYVYIGDVVDALVRAARLPVVAHRVVNIGSGAGRSLTEVIDGITRLRRTHGARPPEVVHRPGRRVDVPRIVLDIARAREALGWEPATPWEEALTRTHRWYAAEAAEVGALAAAG